MSDEPIFSATPVGEEPPKPKRRRATPRRPRASISVASRARTKSNPQDINRAISAIYREDNGKIADMQKIQVKKNHPVAKALFILIIVGGLLSAAAWVGFFMMPQNKKLSAEQVTLKIDGPAELVMGATTTYSLSFRNDQKVNLKNVLLAVRYPAGFVFAESSEPAANAGHTEWNIGTLAPGEKKTLDITGLTFGAPEEEQSWRVFLNYQPENFNSELQKTAILNTKMALSPFAVSIAGPDKAQVGADVVYTIKLENKGAWQPAKLELVPIFPANFHFASSSPKLDKNNKWIIDLSRATSTAALSALEFKVSGQYAASDAAEALKANLTFAVPAASQTVTVAQSELKTELEKNAINFAVAINGTMKDFTTPPGEMLNITLNIKNTSAKDITKASAVFTLDAPALKKVSILDWAELVDQNDGDVMGKQLSDTVRRGQITWNSKKIPALAKIKAGEEVNIDFRLPIKNGAKFDLADLSEYKILANADLNYTDANNTAQSIASSPIAITLNSDLAFEMRHALAPMADGKEEHKITWVVNNTFHALKNVKLTADAFGDITWNTNTSSTPAGELRYDPTSKKITWTIENMPLSVDVLALPLSIVLNSKNPTQNTLVSKVHITAEDMVTGQTLDFMGDEVLLAQ